MAFGTDSLVAPTTQQRNVNSTSLLDRRARAFASDAFVVGPSCVAYLPVHENDLDIRS